MFAEMYSFGSGRSENPAIENFNFEKDMYHWLPLVDEPIKHASFSG